MRENNPATGPVASAPGRGEAEMDTERDRETDRQTVDGSLLIEVSASVGGGLKSPARPSEALRRS